MAMRDLIPWGRGRDMTVRRGEDMNPFLTLHREMNRLFDDAFRGFDICSLLKTPSLQPNAWPPGACGARCGCRPVSGPPSYPCCSTGGCGYEDL